MIRNECVSCDRKGADIRRRSQCNAHNPSLVFCFACIPQHCHKYHKEYLVLPSDLIILRHLFFGGLNALIWCLLTVSLYLQYPLGVVFFSGVALVVGLLTVRAYGEHQVATATSKIST